MDPIIAGLAHQFAAAQHVIDMGEHLAKRKASLVRVEQADEQGRDQFGGSERLGPARLGDPFAACRVMIGQFVDARMQAVERQPVTGQSQHVVRHRRAQCPKVAQIDAQRIFSGLHRMHADVRGDACDHLIRGKQQPIGGLVQHRLFQRVAAAGQDFEVATADPPQIAVFDAFGRMTARRWSAAGNSGRGQGSCRSYPATDHYCGRIRDAQRHTCRRGHAQP